MSEKSLRIEGMGETGFNGPPFVVDLDAPPPTGPILFKLGDRVVQLMENGLVADVDTEDSVDGEGVWARMGLEGGWVIR